MTLWWRLSYGLITLHHGRRPAAILQAGGEDCQEGAAGDHRYCFEGGTGQGLRCQGGGSEPFVKDGTGCAVTETQTIRVGTLNVRALTGKIGEVAALATEAGVSNVLAMLEWLGLLPRLFGRRAGLCTKVLRGEMDVGRRQLAWPSLRTSRRSKLRFLRPWLTRGK